MHARLQREAAEIEQMNEKFRQLGPSRRRSPSPRRRRSSPPPRRRRSPSPRRRRRTPSPRSSRRRSRSYDRYNRRRRDSAS